MKLNKFQLLFIGLNEKLTEELYNIGDLEIESIGKYQRNNRDSLLNKLGNLMLSNKIVDNYLNMTRRDRKKEYNYMANEINKLLKDESKYESDRVKSLLKDIAVDRYDMNSYLMDIGSIDFKLPKLDNKKVEKIINKKVKGKVYSERIWKNKNKVAKDLKLTINKFLKGEINVNDIYQLIKNKYNSNYKTTKRLVDNEIARVQNAMNEEWFKEHDAEWVYYSATLDKRTCKDCSKYHDKTYRVDDSSRPELPKHVRCRCCYILIVDPNWRPGKVDNVYDSFKSWVSNEPNTNNPNTGVNWDMVNDKSYKSKFKGIGLNSIVDGIIYKYTVQALKHRENTLYEDLYVVDKETGNLLSFETDSKIARQVSLSEKTIESILSHDGEVILIHNHPGSTTFSPADINLLSNSDKISSILACCHNGDVHIASGLNDKFNIAEEFNREYTRYRKLGFTDDTSREKAWKDVSIIRGFKYEVR